MKLLMISTDRGILAENTEVRERMRSYGVLAEELHIVVFMRRSSKGAVKIAENVWAHPTNSRNAFWYVRDGYAAAQRLLRTKGEWIISAQDPFLTGCLGWLLRLRFRRARLQLQVHTDMMSPYFARESFKNRVRVFLAKRLLKRADGIRVVSRRIRESLITYDIRLTTKIFVLPIFVDVKRFGRTAASVSIRERFPEFNRVVLMASRLTREKNIPLVLRAFKGITRRFPRTLLLIVGEGSEEYALRRLADQLGIERNVRFEPWAADLGAYYRAADIFLLTSDYEGYGRTVVEAMASGVAVIMTDVGVAGELLEQGKNGLVVPVRDVGALTIAIEMLLGDAKRRASFARAGQASLAALPDRRAYMAAYRASLRI